MALTTSDEIQKQLTLYFGFKGQLEIDVGHIIGIGKLTQKNTEYLIQKMLNFLNSYNGLLRDYAGCELYSITFELDNLDKVNEQLQIMPKAMLFVPGEYKDCNTLLLLLSNELSLLDHGKAKDSVDDLGKLYFEVEEITNRDELNKNQREMLLKRFAERFAYKLQGQAIEGRWNRKLVGLKTTDERTEELFEYLIINTNYHTRWDLGKEIEPLSPKMQLTSLKWQNETQYDFMKHIIFPSAAYVIAQNTFRLTSNLMKIANTGTVDDLQDQILLTYLENCLEYAEDQSTILNINEFKEIFLNYRIEFEKYLTTFFNITMEFVKSGQVGSLNELLTNYKERFSNRNTMEERTLAYFSEFFITRIENNRNFSQSKTRTIEFESILLYFKSSAEILLKSLKNVFPHYFRHYLLMKFAANYTDLLISEFKTQRKAVMALGIKYIQKYASYIMNQIIARIYDLTSITPENLNQEAVHQEFKSLIRQSIEPFINEVNIEIGDIMSFVEMMLEEVPHALAHIQKLSCFTSEIEFIWGLILRFSTFNRFIRDLPDDVELDPSSFATRFIDFLRKRLGGFDLTWIDYSVGWITEFANEYQPKYDLDKEQKQKWPRKLVLDYFIAFFTRKIEEETTIEGFKKPIRAYVNKLIMNFELRNLGEIANTYEMCLELITQFPDYIRQTFIKLVDGFPNKITPQSASVFMGKIPSEEQLLDSNFEVLNLDRPINKILIAPTLRMDGDPAACEDYFTRHIGKDIFQQLSFYEFILQRELKYFSDIIAKPKSVILRSMDKKSFDGKDLMFHLDFKYWDKFLKIFISSNYLKVKPKFS